MTTNTLFKGLCLTLFLGFSTMFAGRIAKDEAIRQIKHKIADTCTLNRAMNQRIEEYVMNRFHSQFDVDEQGVAFVDEGIEQQDITQIAELLIRLYRDIEEESVSQSAPKAQPTQPQPQAKSAPAQKSQPQPAPKKQVPTKTVAWDLHSVVFTKQGKHGHNCEPVGAMVQIIRDLNAHGVRQVILSNISAESFNILKKRNPELFACFDLSGSLADAQGIFTRKPHRKYFDRFKERNKSVQSKDIIFLDDLEKNIVGARKSGFDAYKFTTPARARELFKKKGLL